MRTKSWKRSVIFISRNFRYFLFGITFVTIIIPVLEEISQIIITLLELVKGKITIPITKMNSTIKKIANEEEPYETRAIGFTSSFDEEEDETDEDL